MKKTANILISAAVLALAIPIAVSAHAQIVTTNVAFPRGSTGSTFNGSIKGRVVHDYVVRASAGQVLTVRMTGAPIVFFNVLPPGSTGEGIFNGSVEGNSFGGTLSVSGAYKIRVYQMAASGRRGEVGNFRLSISVPGRGSGTPGGGGGMSGSIAGIQGMAAVAAIDELGSRRFANVDSFSSENTLYGIYFYRPTRLCVQTTSANSRIIDIRDIRTHPKCR